VEEAIRHIRDTSNRGHLDKKNAQDQESSSSEQHQQGKRTALRQILEKQHLVKERTSQNLLEHLRQAQARGQQIELDLAEIRPDAKGLDPNLLRS